MSRGSLVTPSRPTWLAKSVALIQARPGRHSTLIQPKRSSFSSELPNTCVWLATRFRVCVVSDRPNPGTSVSCSALVPNGWSSSASKVLKRANSWSASVSRWSRRTLNWSRSRVQLLGRRRGSGTAAPDVGSGDVAAGTPRRSGRCGSAGIWLFANGVQTPVVGIVSGSQIAPKPGEVAGARGRGRHREDVRVSDRCIRWPFVAAEEERPVLNERPAERAAELVLPERRQRLARRLEVVRRVEGVVAVELEQAAAEQVGAGLGRDVDQRRRLAAELRRIHRLLDLELLDRIDRRIDHQVVEELVGDLGAVEQIDVVPGSLAADVRAAGRPAGALRRACRPAE